MHKSRIALSALSLTLIASSPPARAQDLLVWDSKGTQIGTWFQIDNIRRQFSDGWHVLPYHKQGLPPNAVFFYTKPACAGQRYVGNVDDPGITSDVSIAYYDYYNGEASPGTPNSTGDIWARTGSPSTQTLQSFFSFEFNPTTQKFGGMCFGSGTTVPWGPATASVYPAAPIDTTSRGFAPPFCESVTKTLCH